MSVNQLILCSANTTKSFNYQNAMLSNTNYLVIHIIGETFTTRNIENQKELFLQ